MDMRQAPIRRHMSKAPVAIAHDAKLAQAVALMQAHGVRHLPVLDGERIIGIVSERDLAIVEALVPEDWEDCPVAEAMTPEPYCVAGLTPLGKVARVMAEHRYGCVIVTDDTHALCGLFTTTDALRCLAGM
jgi:acetoin utilization protein AcuB